MLKKLLHKYLPSQAQNNFTLIYRVLRRGGPEARFAVLTSLLGVVASPLDLMLRPVENKRYERAAPPTWPLIFVCGPPRSGTTLLAQVLIKHLPVAYINNLASVFPQSPLTANALFGRLITKKAIEYRAYYGKSRHFSGPNDALGIWDRWFGFDRDTVPSQLAPNASRDMPQFFGALQEFHHKPVVAKNNRLNTCAHLIANVLPNSYFLCLKRDSVNLAQSLVLARREIVGDANRPYGIDSATRDRAASGDYIEDVCRHVMYYERAAEDQQRLIGSDRFWLIEYEQFCDRPRAVVERLATEVLSIDSNDLDLERLERFTPSTRRRLPAAEFSQLEATMQRLQDARQPQLS